MRFEKEKIVKAFSRGATNYDACAPFQKMSASTFASLLESQRNTITAGPILEIGCGTGFLTSHLLHLFPERECHITDISPAMLHQCKRNMKRKDKIQYQVLDGEKFHSENTYSLIVSGLVFQWFNRFRESVLKLKSGLIHQGRLVFSILCSDSFPEWEQICGELGLHCTRNPLPTYEEVAVLPGVQDIVSEEIQVQYANALEFFRSMKQIGTATSKHNNPLSRKEFRRLIKGWDVAKPGGVKITYRVFYVVLEK